MLASELITPHLASRLSRLDVTSRKVLHGLQQGEKRGKRKGASVEFAEHRAYSSGDDLRRIDWNLYARTEKLFLRLFIEEQDLTVSLAIDHSASMDYGDPNKLAYAQRLAAALGWLSLARNNRVACAGLAGARPRLLGGMRGRSNAPRLLQFISEMNPVEGRSDLVGTLRSVATQPTSHGVIFVLSDFFENEDMLPALRSLAGPRREVVLLHLLSPQERAPLKHIHGDLELYDAETQDKLEVSLHSGLQERYQNNLDELMARLRAQSQSQGLRYLPITTDTPVDEVIFGDLRGMGVLT